MKKIIFLIQLNREGKLKLIESNDNIKESYLIKSKNSFKSAKILIENNQIEDSVPMIYYSMYNLLTALLYKCGIKCENHSGSIIMLKEIFDLDNSKIEFAKKERIDKQYYVDFKVTEKQVKDFLKIAEEFNSILYNFIERLNSKEITIYREKLINMLK